MVSVKWMRSYIIPEAWRLTRPAIFTSPNPYTSARWIPTASSPPSPVTAFRATGATAAQLLNTEGVAVDALVASKRDDDGRWPLETRYPGHMPVELDEGQGRPSRWITLRALRVLSWYSTRN